MKTTKFFSLLIAVTLVGCFASCNKKGGNNPENTSKLDASKLIGTWTVTNYSYVKTNTDADTVVYKDVRNNPGTITISKKGDDYVYTENFISTDKSQYEGQLEINEKNGTINLRDAEGFLRGDDFSYELSVGNLTATSMSWSCTYIGTSQSERRNSEGVQETISYNCKEEVNISLTK